MFPPIHDQSTDSHWYSPVIINSDSTLCVNLPPFENRKGWDIRRKDTVLELVLGRLLHLTQSQGLKLRGLRRVSQLGITGAVLVDSN